MAWDTMTDADPLDVFTAALFNQLIANDQHLQSPNFVDEYTTPSATQTSSTSFVDLDAVNLTWDIATSGGYLYLSISFEVEGTVSQTVTFDLAVDGVSISGGNGIVENTGNNAERLSWSGWIDNLSAGTHTVTLRAKVSSGTKGIVAAPLTFTAIGL